MTAQLIEVRPRDARAETTYLCPGCDQPATVEWRDWAPSTSGPVEHVKIRCANRHWFLMLAERLATSPTGQAPATTRA